MRKTIRRYDGSRARLNRGLLVVAVTVLAVPAWAFNPLNGDYTKADPLDVRIMEYNHGGYFISDSSRDAAFNRILVAIHPDIICFEEFPSSVTQTAIANRLNSILPISGGSWQIHMGLLGGTRNVLASRYPLTLTRTDTIPASSTRGVTIALVNLPDATYPVDVYLLGVHFKCCGTAGGTEDASRQDSADAIANWLGDARGVARASGNNITLPASTPMIALGDFNLVGGPEPETTLLTGNILQESTYGADVKGDWDNSNLTNLNPLDPFTGNNFTWQSSGSYAPSALDRMFYTDSVFTVANSFILNTSTMTAAARTAAGLQAGDTLPTSSSDHLPIAMDLRLVTPQCTGNGQCDDGVFCNGAETCVAGTCQPGTAVNCNDNVSCTADSCNETTDACDHVPNDVLCNNGLFCDGVETCNATLGCQAGAPVNCNDNVSCTVDSCNETTDACDHVPSNALCNNGLYCDGVETCHATLGCQAGAPVNCNDNVSCTVDSCNDTTDACDHVPDDALCDDGLFCDGAETCHVTLGCQTGGDPCPGQFCDESGAACVDCLSSVQCDDGVFCNGAELCAGGTCQVGTSPCVGTWCAESAALCQPYGSGDFDSDGDVDLADFAAFENCFGQPAGPACFPGNLVGEDGTIDLADGAAFINVLSGP